jgi:hypothetical protein
MDGMVVAPGVSVPNNINELGDLDGLEDQVACITAAQDGVTFRIYMHCGAWRVSTNGMITPDRSWGRQGRPFIELFNECGLDLGLLNPGLCYYVVMEHTDHINVVKHLSNNLTLVRAVMMDTIIDLNKQELFTEAERIGVVPVQTLTLPYKDLVAAHNTKVMPSPVTSDEVGSIIYLRDGRSFRLETWKYLHASSLKPNVPDVSQMWVHLVALQPGDTVENAADRVKLHLQYFPWNKMCFGLMVARFKVLMTTLSCDYNSKCNGPARHTKFQRELQQQPGATDQELELYLLKQDPARICYLMNPC